MAIRFTFPFMQGIDSGGHFAAGSKLYFYLSGTSTPLDTYSDNALTVVNANPLTADSAGRFGAIFLKDANYKVTLKTSGGVDIWTADPVPGGPTTTATPAVATAGWDNSEAVQARFLSGLAMESGRQPGGIHYLSTASSLTLVSSDLGKAVKVTASATITLPDAGTARAGWWCMIRNTHGSSITVAAGAGNTVEGGASVSLAAAATAIFIRTGATTFERLF